MKQLLCGTVALCLYLAAAGPAHGGIIYWSDWFGGTIRRANLDGSGQTILVTGQSNPVGPELDLAGGRMYWGLAQDSSIRRANLDGTGQTDVVTGAGPGVPALDLVGGRMYWNNSSSGTIQSAYLDGTGRTTLVTGQSNPHAVRLDLAAGHMYWPEADGGRIRRANLDGTGLTTLVSGLSIPNLLALDLAGGHIYWTNAGNGDIRRANLDGSGQATLVRNQNNPSGITLDVSGSKMYWANRIGGDIRRANLDGSGEETLFTGLPGPNFIALDLTSESAPLHTWNIDANGNWSAAGNWTINVPNAAGVELVLGDVITSPRTVTVDRPITVGRIEFDSTNAYTIAGSSTLTLDATSGDAQINVTSGSHTISAPLRLLDNTTITVTPAASNLSVTGPFVGQKVTKAGAGALTLSQVRAPQLTINEGKAAVAPTGTSDASLIGSLTIAGAPDAPTAQLDINGAMILNYTGATPEAAIRQHVLSGRGGAGLGKDWTGMGITSSAVAAAVATEPESRSIGYAENSALPLGAYTVFRGQTVDNTSLLMAFTRTGDASLDGVVNDDDVTIIGATYAPGVANANWSNGDFDYNGFVDDDDVTLLGVFYDPSATPITAPAAGVAAVPEPGTVALLMTSLIGIPLVLVVRRKSR